MPETTLIVNHEVGLHARPASVFVQTASKFSSDISVAHGDRTANAKSILTVLTLGAHKGAEITITAEGEDADEALAALEELVNSNFGEDE
jgi:phosphotransferase system HPr (HPr) family protein